VLQEEAETIRAISDENPDLPMFGICLGHQLLGHALGCDTYKLTFGHRGINQPVRDEATGQVLVTAHNHGFAVQAPDSTSGREPFETPYGAARVAFTCLNDGVVEGLECLDVPAFSVQFHPEAAAGPHDAAYLFDRFVDLMAGSASRPGSQSAPGRVIPDVIPDPHPQTDATEGTAA
jgi:carbamoyl-phosphate synthase small subunit